MGVAQIDDHALEVVGVLLEGNACDSFAEDIEPGIGHLLRVEGKKMKGKLEQLFGSDVHEEKGARGLDLVLFGLFHEVSLDIVKELVE